METLKRLDEIIRSCCFVNDATFNEVQEIGARVGVNFVQKQCGCSKRDFMLIVYDAYCKFLQKKLVEAGERKLYIRAGLRCLFNNVRVNDLTISTDKQIRALLKKGFPKKFVRTHDELKKYYGIE